jgi:maleate isomerase
MDVLGYRSKLAIVAPSTNTVVQPEMDEMRPRGVTNHIGRILLHDVKVSGDEDFAGLMVTIRGALDEAIASVMTARPDRVVLGISSEAFWDGVDGSRKLDDDMLRLTGGVPVTMASTAVVDALKRYGARRVSIVTPYMPVGDEQVRRYFTEAGLRVVKVKGLRCESPTKIAHVPASVLRDCVTDLARTDCDAVLQVGTNLPFAKLAGEAEFWFNKPVLAINTVIYWSALRSSGINDSIAGFGSLLERH